MKKIVSLVLITALTMTVALGLSSCEDENPEDAATESVTAEGSDTTVADGEDTTAEDTDNSGATTSEETSSSDETEPHTHIYGDWTATKEPTCTEKGSKERVCFCGDKITEEISEKGHSFVWVVDKAATQTETGLKHEKCSCGEKRSENTVIPKQDCNHSMKKTNAVKPTCTKDGNIEHFTCSKCQKIFSDENGNIEITKGETVKNATGHTEVIDKAVAPSCSKTGLTEGKHCSVCCEMLKKQETVSALGHDYGEWKNNGDDTHSRSCNRLNCDAKETASHSIGKWKNNGDGTHSRTCSACSKKETASHAFDDWTDNENGTHYRTCGICDKKEFAIHTYGEWVTTKEPTCTQTGTKEKVCACGNKVTEQINELEHNYKNDICTECGAKKPSEGLMFRTLDGGKAYEVVGIGTCKDTDIVIPSTYNGLPVTSIGQSAFEDCDSLRSITIPDGITSIRGWAFQGCSSLTSVTMSNSVTTIAIHAFSSCKALTSIIIPNSVIHIGEWAFAWCESLTSVTFENTNGWEYGTSSSISSTDLANKSTAATFLRLTYKYWAWGRS